jgi:catechol 2,3-dioxygenase-like lactoylglutathione lyase family enzyme
MPATKIHHINFLVENLDEAIPRFEKMLGLAPFEIVDHAPRGAHIARSKLGESWFVLVSPYEADSVPGRHLAAHGEGFFLLSLDTDDPYKWRDGILDWQVSDIGTINGALFQVTKSQSPANSEPTIRNISD